MTDMLRNLMTLRMQHEGRFLWMGRLGAAIFCSIPAYFGYERYANRRRIRQYASMIGDKVYMDIAVGDRYAGRIIFGLYSQQTPLTCENFLQLCKGYQVGDKVIGYRNTYFHLVRPSSALVGGDVLTGTGRSRGLSIYGEAFPDENFDMMFVREGDLAMVNWGRNTNSSLFMITLSQQMQLYGHHVVFGTVVKGMKVVRQMSEMAMQLGRPAVPLRILQCGVWEEDAESSPPPAPVGFEERDEPIMSEDDFRAKLGESKGTRQPS